MIPVPSNEDLERLRVLHDKIKNHPFRKDPQKYLLDEYAELFQEAGSIISEFAPDGYDENYNRLYKYYKGVRDRWLHYKDSHSKDGYFHYNDVTEIWSNPTIAIYNYSIHDFNGIWWKLKANWDNNFYYKDLYGRFTETTEKRLMLIHNLINGELITEMKFPVERCFSKDYEEFKMVQNPNYDNQWTLPKYLHKVWWEDKGYED